MRKYGGFGRYLEYLYKDFRGFNKNYDILIFTVKSPKTTCIDKKYTEFMYLIFNWSCVISYSFFHLNEGFFSQIKIMKIPSVPVPSKYFLALSSMEVKEFQVSFLLLRKFHLHNFFHSQIPSYVSLNCHSYLSLVS